jgi:putative SOS response-associated peptidase YedK
MCGRYVIVSKVEVIEKKFHAKSDFPFEPNFNVSAGAKAPIITNENPQKIQLAHFGFTPSFAAKKTYILNARAEGDHNTENRSNFTGAKGIIKKPYFRKAIRSQRCLVIADAFIEGTTANKLDEPYLVYLKDKARPFAFAGIYDEWLDPNTGESHPNFAIITCPPNLLMEKIQHHRMPVILPEEFHNEYLNLDIPLSDITSMLQSYPANQMNAFKISPAIKSPKNNAKEYLQPVSEWVQPEKELKVTNQIDLFGMGDSRRKRNKENDK